MLLQSCYNSLNFFSSENLLLLAGLASLIVLFTGGYPGYFFSKIKTIKILSAKKITQQGRKLRNCMIIFQFVVSIFLIATTIFTYKQLEYIKTADWGMSYEKIVQVKATKSVIDHFDAYRFELLKDPNISSVTAASTFPSGIGNHGMVRWSNAEGPQEGHFKFAMVKPEYVETFGMEIIKGQAYRPNVPQDLDKFLINQSLKDMLNFEGSPIGQTIKFWGKEGDHWRGERL